MSAPRQTEQGRFAGTCRAHSRIVERGAESTIDEAFKIVARFSAAANADLWMVGEEESPGSVPRRGPTDRKRKAEARRRFLERALAKVRGAQHSAASAESGTGQAESESAAPEAESSATEQQEQQAPDEADRSQEQS